MIDMDLLSADVFDQLNDGGQTSAERAFIQAIVVDDAARLGVKFDFPLDVAIIGIHRPQPVV